MDPRRVSSHPLYALLSNSLLRLMRDCYFSGVFCFYTRKFHEQYVFEIADTILSNVIAVIFVRLLLFLWGVMQKRIPESNLLNTSEI